jgi:hypothetical protein
MLKEKTQKNIEIYHNTRASSSVKYISEDRKKNAKNIIPRNR